MLVQASLLYQILFFVQYQSLADLAILSTAIDENKTHNRQGCAILTYARVIYTKELLIVVRLQG